MDTPINQVLLVIVILFNVSTAYNGTRGRLHGFRCNQLLNRYMIVNMANSFLRLSAY